MRFTPVPGTEAVLHSVSHCQSSRKLEEVQRLWFHMWEPLERMRRIRAGVAGGTLDFMEEKGV